MGGKRGGVGPEGDGQGGEPPPGKSQRRVGGRGRGDSDGQGQGDRVPARLPNRWQGDSQREREDGGGGAREGWRQAESRR